MIIIPNFLQNCLTTHNYSNTNVAILINDSVRSFIKFRNKKICMKSSSLKTLRVKMSKFLLNPILSGKGRLGTLMASLFKRAKMLLQKIFMAIVLNSFFAKWSISLPLSLSLVLSLPLAITFNTTFQTKL